MGLIVEAGNARASAFTALAESKKGEISKAEELMNQAEKSMNKAHNQQSQILTAEANKEIDKVNLLTVHAQDHLMTAILAIELVGEIIELRNELDEIKKD